MFRSASRAALRSANSAPRCLPRAPSARRFLSTAPPTQKSRSWKSSAVRWGIAVGAIYYYNTSDVFADQPALAVTPATASEPEPLPTLESIAAQKHQRQGPPSATVPPTQTTIEAEATAGPLGEGGAAPGSPEALQEEADQQGAFNPETGEINWDCPCLGGMAHGPCGEEFKAAFSCFVYSKEEPKGMDCIDKFKGMQDCFRQYPEIYGEEIDDDNDVTDDNAVDASVGQDLSGAPAGAPSADKVAEHKPQHPASPEHEAQGKTERAKSASKQVKESHGEQSESEAAVPKSWHDSK